MTELTSPPFILCFGDSLTVGYQSPTPQHPNIRETPYGHCLQTLVGHKATIRVSGVCGEVTGEMVMRFRQDVIAHRPAYAVILGGTNDLGWNANPSEIFRNLVKLYESARHADIMPIAITVPSILPAVGDQRAEKAWVTDLLQTRAQLNGLIREYCLSQGVPFVDLNTATADPETQLLMNQFSNDGLHLTTAGYECLAHLLYDNIFKEII